jgi:uncharacterized pyridoxamine 5'-phosphate oxidase family protein
MRLVPNQCYLKNKLGKTQARAKGIMITIEQKLKRVSSINKRAYKMINDFTDLQNSTDNPNSFWNGYRALNEFLCDLAKLNQHLENVRKGK